MARCRHHSGYLADDEAGHSMYMARVQLPKKPLLPKVGPASKHAPHPPPVVGSSAPRGHRRNPRGPQAFGSFLDFLTESQVLDSLQSVVEEATERVAAMKTEAGVPLVEVQDAMEGPRGGRRARARPSFSTMRRHRAQPTLCTGHPNNYPSCSSSVSNSHSNLSVGCLGSRGLDSLPPMRDKLLLEKTLKRQQRLENKGKGLSQSCSRKDSQLWDSLDSQTSSQWTQEQPMSWFSELLGSDSGTPKVSEMGPAERELTFLKRKFNKEMKSLWSQPAPSDLPGYCSIREPHCTLDFLAKHHLFPILQSVVSQAVDKLRGACLHDGSPLFPTSSQATSGLPVNYDLPPASPSDSKPASPAEREEAYSSLPTTASSPKITRRRSKGRRGSPSMSNPQVATRFRLKVTPTEEPNDPSPSLNNMQEMPDSDPTLQQPSVAPSSSQRAQCRHGLHLILPGPGVTVEVASNQDPLRDPVPHLLTSLDSPSPFLLSMFSPLSSSGRSASPSASQCPESPSIRFPKKKPLPSISLKSSLTHIPDPWYEELIDFLVERAVSLIICKYKFEDSLSKQLGFISFPITEVLMDLFLGFKKLKGSRICLSSDINWTCLLRKLEEAELARQTSKQASRPGAIQPSATQLGASQQAASWSSPESPSMQPSAATNAQPDQAASLHPSLDNTLPIHQLLSLQEATPAMEQDSSSPSQPSPSRFSISHMGFSPPEPKEVVSNEDGGDSKEEEHHGRDMDKIEEKGEDKDISEGESEVQTLPEPRQEASTQRSVDPGHSEPP